MFVHDSASHIICWILWLRGQIVAWSYHRYDNGTTPASMYLWHRSAWGNADGWFSLAWGRHVDNLQLLAPCRHSSCTFSWKIFNALGSYRIASECGTCYHWIIGFTGGKGVLTRRNCMSLDELLNPARENEVIKADISDQDIFDAVHANWT